MIRCVNGNQRNLMKKSLPYKLRKSKSLFYHILRSYNRKKKVLSLSIQENLRDLLIELQDAIREKNREKASELAIRLETLSEVHLKKTPYYQIKDFIFALVFALCLAVIIRSVWFEFYEIPTGSMRPTLKEKDHLAVSKTAFGINIPLTTKHLYFNPDLIQRNGIFIFTGEGMDITDVNTRYFYIFPGKKQYVKRLIGKPGDTLYFYGGKIYGVDNNNQDITPLLNPPLLNHLDHVPFIYFNGRTNSGPQSVTLRQMNEPVAKLYMNYLNKPSGELLSPYNKDIHDYFDLWGFKNFGMVRLLTKTQALALTDILLTQLEEAPLYLEIFHHPSIRYPILDSDHAGQLRLSTRNSISLLPLRENHLKTLFQNLYTARFHVIDGYAVRYGSKSDHKQYQYYSPKLEKVPDGTYEFYYGKAYQILWGGITKELPSDHPLYQFSIDQVQTLFNLGIEFNTFFEPHSKQPYYLPSRYTYFRDGNLYVMGAPLMKKDDPHLTTFVDNELTKQRNAPSYNPYFPFIDSGPPLKEGVIDLNFIHKYGVRVPEGYYLALGDNYAMSADSRDFGFVPESNIRGAPTFIFWPFGDRFGKPLQPPYPFFNAPRITIWVSLIFCELIFLLFYYKRRKMPIKIE